MKNFKLIASILVFVMSTPSWAYLAGDAKSVEKDRVALNANDNGSVSSTGQAYTVKEIKIGKNSVREYLTTSGTVFAVAWSGLSHPRLDQLLGSYWSEYHQLIVNNGRKTANSKVYGTEFVVEKSGHMRAVRGRAYVQKLIPKGVNLNEVK